MRFCFCFFSLFFFSLWCSYDLHLDYEYATFSAVPIYNFTDYFVPIHTCLTRSLFMCDQLKQKGTYERPIWASPSSNRTPLTNCDVFSLFFSFVLLLLHLPACINIWSSTKQVASTVWLLVHSVYHRPKPWPVSESLQTGVAKQLCGLAFNTFPAHMTVGKVSKCIKIQMFFHGQERQSSGRRMFVVGLTCLLDTFVKELHQQHKFFGK